MPRYEPVIRPGVGSELMLRLAWPSSLPVGDYRNVEIDHWVVDRRRRLTLAADATSGATTLSVASPGALWQVQTRRVRRVTQAWGRPSWQRTRSLMPMP